MVGAASDGCKMACTAAISGPHRRSLLTVQSNSRLEAVLLLQRDLAGLRSGLGRRALRRCDSEHAHRLQPKAEPLTPIGGRHVETGEVAHTLEPGSGRGAGGGEVLPPPGPRSPRPPG